MGYEDKLDAMSDYNAEKIGEGIEEGIQEEHQRILIQEFYIVVGYNKENEQCMVSNIFENKEDAEFSIGHKNLFEKRIFARFIIGENPK